MNSDFDIVIIGAGLVGLTTALSCAQSGARVAVLDRRDVTIGKDGRASALSATSLRVFENLGVDIAEHLQPISDMLVTDGGPESPWRLHFEGDGDGGDLGALIENPALKSALLEAVKASDAVTILAPIDVEQTHRDTAGVTIETDQGSLTARLLVAADGRDSVVRRKSGITSQRFDYDASSLVTTLSHDLPHEGLAWQRMIAGGALAVLPLTGNRSQIVWSGPTEAIAAATDLPEADFLALLSEKMDGYLGEMTLLAPRQHYPLRLQVADSFTAERLALAGDAAHAIHPLAGQGLNLGIRDAAALTDGVQMAIETGQDIGVASLLDYDLWRNTDTRAFGFLTHLIAKTSTTNMNILDHSRRLGLVLTNGSHALRSSLGKRAAGEGGALPSLMKNNL